jgi:(p)ppGpp synthase/HD superfamily hydrolase
MSTRLGTLAGTAGVDDALAFLAQAYGSRLRRAGRTDEHPIAVGRLLAADGQPAPVVVAGLLHDVLEDTGASASEVHARFGACVARLVQALTQDASLEDYRERKAALRRRIVEAGPQAATISLADKVAKLQVARQPPRKRRMRHYRATLEDVEERYGRSPLSTRLSELLARW